MIRRPPRPTRTDTRVPSTTLCRSVVAADQPRALRNEERASGRAVVDALGHLGGDQPRQVGPQPREQARRYDAAGRQQVRRGRRRERVRSEEHTSELQSLMRISYAVFCLKKKQQKKQTSTING